MGTRKCGLRHGSWRLRSGFSVGFRKSLSRKPEYLKKGAASSLSKTKAPRLNVGVAAKARPKDMILLKS